MLTFVESPKNGDHEEFTIGVRDRRFSVILQKWAWTQACFKLNT